MLLMYFVALFTIGILLALVSAVKGYKCTVALPDRFNDEKVLGADVIRTRAVPLHHHENDHFIAGKLGQENPRWHNLVQFSHPGNALAHYDITAEEILQSCDGQLDMLVAGSGSGGTLTGLARKIKEVCPNCKIIGGDPVGSMEAGPPEINVNVGCKWLVEGIGQSFKPAILDRTLVDKWYKVKDEPFSFEWPEDFLQRRAYFAVNIPK